MSACALIGEFSFNSNNNTKKVYFFNGWQRKCRNKGKYFSYNSRMFLLINFRRYLEISKYYTHFKII